MPGGQSSSFLSVDVDVVDGGGEDDFEERSTGSWLLVPVPLLVLVAAVGGEILGEGTEDGAVRALEGRRGLSKFPVVIVVEAGGDVVVGAAVLAGLVLGGI